MSENEEKIVDGEGNPLDKPNDPDIGEGTISVSEDADMEDSIDGDFADLARAYDASNAIRTELAEKLLGEIKKTNLSLDQKPDTVEVKLASISTLASLLNDRDKRANEKLKLKLDKRNGDSNAEAAKLVTSFLIQIGKQGKASKTNTGLPKEALKSFDDDIDQLYKDSCEPILAGELIVECPEN